MSAPAVPGALMGAEAAEAPGAFARAAGQEVALPPGPVRAVYTVARGSSDAAALVLAYEVMREAQLPATSLPPSTFSLGEGVALDGALVLLVSQSGASDDLVASARGARRRGATVAAVVNAEGSPAAREATLTVPIGAGPERAVPATKSVTGAIGAGTALLAALVPGYGARAAASARVVAERGGAPHPRAAALRDALAGAPSVYVVGRDCGLGAAQEVALKLKETSALHAEALSASEVLHGPLQLAAQGLLALLLDTGAEATQGSLDLAERRLRESGAEVLRVAPADVGAGNLTPAAAAALLLCLMYPVIREVALLRGQDPDAPAFLSKVTRTT
jgi:glucosamine--fructose-6-phosphate aminotransferase (isomerizing)